MVLVDTNVILDIATNDPRWFDWSHAQLEPLINAGEAAINPVIYTELVPAARAVADLDTVIVPPGDFQRLPLPYAAAVPTARAFAAYRQAGGAKTSPLPDFFVGAHAEVENIRWRKWNCRDKCVPRWSRGTRGTMRNRNVAGEKFLSPGGGGPRKVAAWLKFKNTMRRAR